MPSPNKVPFLHSPDVGGTHRLKPVPGLVPVYMCPPQPSLEAPITELGTTAITVIQFSHLGYQERGNLAKRNHGSAGVCGAVGKRPSKAPFRPPRLLPHRAWKRTPSKWLLVGRLLGVQSHRAPWSIRFRMEWSLRFLERAAYMGCCSLAPQAEMSPEIHLDWPPALRTPTSEPGEVPEGLQVSSATVQ